MLFDKYSINAQYGLTDVQDKYTHLATTITMDGLNQVLQDLCITGTKWTLSRQDYYTVERASLKPSCRVWYHFLKSRLSPFTHNSTILKERMLLLYSIMMGRNIDMGKIIFKEIHMCAQKNVGSLNFPSLIAALFQ